MNKVLISVFLMLVLVSTANAATENECIYGLGLSAQAAQELCGAVDVDGNMIPSSNSSYDLGSAALSFEDIYSETMLLDNDSTSNLDADVIASGGTTAQPLLGISGTSLTQTHLALIQNIASAQGAELMALKTRAAAGSTNANTIIASGDDILKITAKGANGATYDPAAQIVLESGGTPGASADMPGRVVVLTSPDGSATPAAVATFAADKSITFTGTLIGTGTSTLGWEIVAGANAACTTTCTTPCVFGVNTAATEADIVACADTTADECLCAGAS